ncbi:MAG: hypothetical protein HC815_21505 [Richelia sp. RM1_1_1]|nr:hypothetical protein [Richelia sp. SM1_7_0]NJN10424.1 hypothetical protein [Richelia sp. RM1_1_1]
MDRKALGMAIFMGLYVPLFTAISVTIHRFTHSTTKENNKIIIVHRQFEKQSFHLANKNSIFNLDTSKSFSFSTDILESNSLNFYKLLPPAYVRDNNNLLHNLDFNQITFAESKVN